MKEIKNALPEATAGEVLCGIELLVCHRQDLNPLLVPVLFDGRLVDRPLEVSGWVGARIATKAQAAVVMPQLYLPFAGLAASPPQFAAQCAPQSFQYYHAGRVVTFRMLSRLGGPSGAGALPPDEAAAVAEECAATGLFWEALARGGRQAAVDSPAVSFSAIATAASGRRLQLTWRRRGRQLLPFEVSELPAGPDGDAQAAAKYLVWRQQQQELQEQFELQKRQADEAQQRDQQAQAAARPSAPLPPPPFGPAGAAMLLTGLAQMELRVSGVVEPLLRQCESAMPAATANDVARILIALGELRMDIGGWARLAQPSPPACKDSALLHRPPNDQLAHAGLSTFARACRPVNICTC
jgi:hypothetical protein